MHAHHPPFVTIRETSLRDGLQSINSIVPTSQKLEWLNRSHAAGLREIEVGSFVPAKLLPQLADTGNLVAHGLTLPGLKVSALVPNLKGAELAMHAGAHIITVPISASHLHSLANLKKTPGEAVAELARIRAQRDATGSRALIEGGVSTAFGCTLQGEVSPAEVLRLVQELLNAGADLISLGDTVGYATPSSVRSLFEQAINIAGKSMWSAHFHDTRGLGLANVYAAWSVGINRFDACVGGIGGCPHAPGASGNVNTEDLHFMLTHMGVRTGLSMERLLELRSAIRQWLPQESLYGVLWRTGLPKTFLEIVV